MFIIYHPRAYVRKVAKQLGVSAYFPSDRSSRERQGQMTHVINWGCAPSLLKKVRWIEGQPILNADVQSSRSKVATFKLLDAAGVRIPRFTLDPKEGDFYKDGKYLARRDKLSGGRGIQICESGTLPDGEFDFYSRVITKVMEVRVHVGNDPSGTAQILCDQIKYVPKDSKVLIRSYDNGARFTNIPLAERIDGALASTAHLTAIAALDACHLDFAAIDMALDKNNRWVVFETNTAPGISAFDANDDHAFPSSFDAYVAYFKQYLR